MHAHKNKFIMKKYQKEIDDWFKKNKWQYWRPLSILARLYEECGEFAREVNHLYGEKKKKKNEISKKIEEEMGDIVFTLMCFANSQGIDLGKAVKKSINKVKKRDKDRFK
ncbi:MAG: MazG nucleotide pyrophosphohydrolase domain-containing protein [bacterium]|nr:MazG nucleotide pyrophosphohydrolase domain-containing protein [bacterium]